jgi:hypothetical protein
MGGASNPGAQSSPATPIAPVMAAVATLPLQAMAQSDAPGMQADGGAFAGNFQEGQTLEQVINLQAGKCYTVVAQGAGAVQEVHVQIAVTPMQGMSQVMAQDGGTPGPIAVLGSKKNGGCWTFMSPVGLPGKVLLKVTKGSGLAAAQVFVK